MSTSGLKQGLKQQQAHPKYPWRGDLDNPNYFTHPSVINNIRTLNKPFAWADPFWNDMTQEEKNAVLARVPVSGPLETRKYDASKFPGPLFVGAAGIERADIFNAGDNTYCGPLNPMGRTGMIGRGLLGQYAINYAADPLVSRFKDGCLEIAAIRREDTGEWAIPGGMVEKGATVSATLRNEFNQEALGNSLETGDSEYGKSPQDPTYIAKIAALQNEVDKLFSTGTEVYKGWVDDPRNTDWAWIETTAVHFHIEDNSDLHGIELRPATDAIGAKWYRLDTPAAINKLYASHGDFVLRAITKKIDAGVDTVKWLSVFMG